MKKSGFTLIELSIVLVIIGLIVGGVLVGRELIRAAELRSVVSQVDAIKTAAQAFRLKYNCLPGDCSNAADYFGLYTANANTCTFFATSGTGVCNGDNNGQIDRTNVAGGWHEPYQLWRHLALAGLFPGSYTGASADTGNPAATTIDLNIPSSKLPGGAFFVHFIGRVSSGTTRYWGDYGNAIQFAAPTSGDAPNTRILSVPDALSLDTKIDDGTVIGKVRPYVGGICTNSGASADLTGNTLYASTASNAPACALHFTGAF